MSIDFKSPAYAQGLGMALVSGGQQGFATYAESAEESGIPIPSLQQIISRTYDFATHEFNRKADSTSTRDASTLGRTARAGASATHAATATVRTAAYAIGETAGVILGGTADASRAQDQAAAHRRALINSQRAQIDLLSTKVARHFLYAPYLTTLSMVQSSIRYHFTNPAYALEAVDDAADDHLSTAVAATSIRNGIIETISPLVKKNIIALSALDRFASLGFAIASLVMTVVRLATTLLVGIGALFVAAYNILSGDQVTLVRNRFVIELSHLTAMSTLFAAHLVGIFHLDTRDNIVLDMANAFSDRDVVKQRIAALHIVQGTTSVASRRHA